MFGEKENLFPFHVGRLVHINDRSGKIYITVRWYYLLDSATSRIGPFQAGRGQDSLEEISLYTDSAADVDLMHWWYPDSERRQRGFNSKGCLHKNILRLLAADARLQRNRPTTHTRENIAELATC